MKPGDIQDSWGGSMWVEKTPEESKREDALEELMKKVSTFFYENENFVNVFETFVERNAHLIDVKTDEMKLSYTNLYNEYQQLFEQHIEGFIEAQGFTPVDFYGRVREAQDNDPWSHEAVFGKIMVATADFDIFMNMMREAAQARSEKAQGCEEGKEGADRK